VIRNDCLILIRYSGAGNAFRSAHELFNNITASWEQAVYAHQVFFCLYYASQYGGINDSALSTIAVTIAVADQKIVDELKKALDVHIVQTLGYFSEFQRIHNGKESSLTNQSMFFRLNLFRNRKGIFHVDNKIKHGLLAYNKKHCVIF